MSGKQPRCVCANTFLCVFRHEERTWSLERSDSFLSDSPGMMSSSVGTSKCSSPACMEARARRAAHCGYSDSHRPGLQYGDSFDSLGDSPHSDRCGAACRGCFAVVCGRSGAQIAEKSPPVSFSQVALRRTSPYQFACDCRPAVNSSDF